MNWNSHISSRYFNGNDNHSSRSYGNVVSHGNAVDYGCPRSEKYECANFTAPRHSCVDRYVGVIANGTLVLDNRSGVDYTASADE